MTYCSPVSMRLRLFRQLVSIIVILIEQGWPFATDPIPVQAQELFSIFATPVLWNPA